MKLNRTEINTLVAACMLTANTYSKGELKKAHPKEEKRYRDIEDKLRENCYNGEEVTEFNCIPTQEHPDLPTEKNVVVDYDLYPDNETGIYDDESGDLERMKDAAHDRNNTGDKSIEGFTLDERPAIMGGMGYFTINPGLIQVPFWAANKKGSENNTYAWYEDEDVNKAKETAQRIVKAVNNHDALVSALKDLLENRQSPSKHSSNAYRDEFNAATNKAKELLSTMEGK